MISEGGFRKLGIRQLAIVGITNYENCELRMKKAIGRISEGGFRKLGTLGNWHLAIDDHL